MTFGPCEENVEVVDGSRESSARSMNRNYDARSLTQHGSDRRVVATVELDHDYRLTAQRPECLKHWVGETGRNVGLTPAAANADRQLQ
ncbi:MAG: hypothetical protein ACRDY6_06525 [Acidimicrobiia bacterium]